jgi:hypothetical protein
MLGRYKLGGCNFPRLGGCNFPKLGGSSFGAYNLAGIST